MDSEHLEAYLADELDESGRRQVEHALRHDAALRASFVVQAQTDAALRALLGSGREAFEAGVIARLRSEGAGERSFAKSVLLEIVEEREGRRPIAWPDLVKTGLISAAASIGLLLLLQSIIFRSGAGRPESDAKSGPAFAARVERSEDLVWHPSSLAKVREDGWLSPGMLRLESGTAAITFNSGATALVEGPAELSVESVNRLFLKSGRLAADVPPQATGFTVNTPRLNAVDLGTRFGISVDEEGNSELHVMEGEVAASRTSGHSVATVVREGLALRADGRTRSELVPVPYGGDTFRLRLGTPAAVQPALRYAFDESYGAIIEDSGRTRLFDVPLVATGELGRSPRRSAGRVGGGLVFQPGETLDVPLSHEFLLERPHAVAFWVKLPAKVGRETPERLLEYGGKDGAWRIACHLGEGGGLRGALRVECGDGHVVGGTDLADGKWHHVAYRYLGGGELAVNLHLFVDGRPETLSHVQDAPVPRGRAGRLRLGAERPLGFEGWIDDLVLFREAVSTPTLQKWSE